MDKTETKEMEGETMLNKAITFRRIISNGNYSCVGIPYSDALKVVNQLRSELQKAKELNGELVDAIKGLVSQRSFREDFEQTTKYFEGLIKKSEI